MGVEFGDGIAAEPGICEEFYEASIYLRGFLFVFIQPCGNESSTKAKSKEENARAADVAQEKAKRAEIIGAKQAQDANDTWDQDVTLSTWTIDLQDRIADKPIVSSGILVDVWLAVDGKPHLHLVKERAIGSHFDFFLTCSKPEPRQMRGFPEYFFVAKVQSIRKDARCTNAELITGFTREGPRFTIRGECVELRLNEERVRRDQKAAEQRKSMERLRSLAKP